MKTIRKPIRSWLLFCVFALLGPAIRFILWPSLDWQNPSAITRYIYDLVILLWPTWPVAVIESSTGPFVAVLSAITANIALFGLVGVLIGVLAKHKYSLFICYVGLCVLVILMELWGAGFRMTFINFDSLLTAIFIYGLPFYYLWKR